MKKLLLLTIASLALAACENLNVNNIDVGALYQATTNVVKAYTVSDEQEREMGKNMSAILLGAKPLEDDAQLNRYVNQVGRWLALNSQRPDLAWRFGVINTDSVNAFAAPGGYVFITKGMLMHLNNEAELAAILAHEIIHVNKQHYLEAMKSSSLRGALFTSLSVAADAAKLDQNDQQYREWAEKVSTAAKGVYSKGLSRDDEFEADAQGIRLLAKAGYDPYALISGLQMLEGLGNSEGWGTLLFKTHPKPMDRIEQLSEYLPALENLAYAQVLANRFAANVK